MTRYQTSLLVLRASVSLSESSSLFGQSRWAGVLIPGVTSAITEDLGRETDDRDDDGDTDSVLEDEAGSTDDDCSRRG